MTLAEAMSATTIALVIAMFALTDELPAPQVRRAVLTVTWMLPVSVATAAIAWPVAVRPIDILVALGPLGFFCLHYLLRQLFLRWKKEEPVLCFHRRSSGPHRLWYEPEREDRVMLLDYLYSILVGMTLLFAVAPAVFVFVSGGAEM